MPTLSHRQAALKGIDRELAHLASARRTKSIRRLVYFHLCLRREIVLRRYWARPKTYKHARYACHIDPLLSAPPREFRFLFRMSRPEYLRLALRFGQDVVFQTCSKRQPAEQKIPASSIHLQNRPWARGMRDSASILRLRCVFLHPSPQLNNQLAPLSGGRTTLSKL